MSQQWIWEALAMGKEKALKGVDTSNFDWKSLHPDFGSPLHAVLFGKIRDDAGTESDESTNNGDGFGDLIGDDLHEKQSRLLLLRMAMESGADPDAPAPASCDVQKFWFLEKRGQRKETKSIVFAGKSAFQCLLAAERAIKMTDSGPVDWKEDLEAIDEAIEILTSASNTANNVCVAEGVVETWESMLADKDSADVAFHAEGQDGCCDPGAAEDAEVEVYAHSPVLRAASPVLRAMLATTGMLEGARKVIEVKDSSPQPVRLLLCLIYTGMPNASDEEPNAEVLLCAMLLAHRWQVLHVVHMLASALQRRLDHETFEHILDAALRFELPSLLAACRAFVLANASSLKQRLPRDNSGAFRSSAVRAEVDRILNGGSGSAREAGGHRKRRRRAL